MQANEMMPILNLIRNNLGGLNRNLVELDPEFSQMALKS